MRKQLFNLFVIVLFATTSIGLAACGRNGEPTLGDRLATAQAGGSVQAASAVVTGTPGAAAPSNALSSAVADRIVAEVKKFEKLLVDAGNPLTMTVDSCSGDPEARIVCAADQLRALETAFAGVIKVTQDLKTQYDAVLAELNVLRTQQGNAGNTTVNPGSGNSPSASSGGYLTGSPWQCVQAGGPGVQWNASRGDYFVHYGGADYFSLSGVRYTWAKENGGTIVILNVNTTCSSCHPNGKYAHAMCEAPGPGGSNGGGGGTASGGTASAMAEAQARAEAEAKASVEIKVKVDVKPILIQIGVGGAGTPVPSCMCTNEYNPVCVLYNGQIYTFPNSCVARCAGFTQYVSCASPLATATQSSATATAQVINDPYCTMFPNAPECKKATPGPSCTPTPVHPATATQNIATASPGPTQSVPTTIPIATTKPDCGATMVRETKFNQVRNIDWGDPFNWVILQVWNGKDPNTTMQVVVAPGHNLDLEAENLEGTAWIFKGTQEQVLCRATEMVAEHGGIKLLLWVGPDPVPAGYEKPTNQLGYTMSTWNYGPDGIVETPGTSWASEQLSLGKNTVCNNGDGVTLVQTWSPPDASIVTHVILEKGACVRPLKDIQGSVHHASGGDRFLIIARMHQMSTEVQSRDNPKTLHRLFIGCDPKPTGFKEDLSGWTVVKGASCP